MDGKYGNKDGIEIGLGSQLDVAELRLPAKSGFGDAISRPLLMVSLDG